MSQKREAFRHDEQTGRSERKREDRPEGNRKTFRGCEAAPEAFRAIRFPRNGKGQRYSRQSTANRCGSETS